MFTVFCQTIGYIKSRLKERSTWVGITLAVTSAAALPAPWSYALVAVGIIGAIVPTSGGGQND